MLPIFPKLSEQLLPDFQSKAQLLRVVQQCRIGFYAPLFLSTAALLCALGCEQRGPEHTAPRAAEKPAQEQSQEQHAREDTESPAPPKDETAPDAELCWKPPLTDATLGSPIEDMRLTQPATLNLCGSEESIVKFTPGHKILKYALSQNEDYAFVLLQDSKGGYAVDAFEIQTGRHTGRCPINVERLHRYASLLAVPGESALVRWGAGPSIALSQLCHPDGPAETSPGGPSIELSPDRRYAAVYRFCGAPLASYHGIEIHDLSQGTIVVEKPDAVANAYVSDIEWREGEVAFTIVPECKDGVEEDEVVVPLGE
ncbi:MAG: hypothetical protein ACLFVJ_15985 [Persicimonas sp.]